MILRFILFNLLFFTATLVICVVLPFVLISSQENYLAYIGHFLKSGSWGFSDFQYPQTVQHFLLSSIPQTTLFFLQNFMALFLFFSLILFLYKAKKERLSAYSEISKFLGMPKKKILKQTLKPSLFYIIRFWRYIVPIFFILIVSMEFIWRDSGLGGMAKQAIANNDLPLLQGTVLCAGIIFSCLSFLFGLIKLLDTKNE